MSEHSDKLSGLGLKITGLYLIALLTIIPTFGYFGWIAIKPISLNELGDFLAGAFGPLAIFWLVLGFLQQGRELQNSIKVLELQTKELAESVEQQKQMVTVTEDSLEHNRLLYQHEKERRANALRPAFDIHYVASLGTIGYTSRNVTIQNTGASISDVDISIMDKDHSPLSNRKMTLFSNGKTEGIDFGTSSDTQYPLTLKVSYKNGEDIPCEKKYQINVNSEERASDKFRTEEVKT